MILPAVIIKTLQRRSLASGGYVPVLTALAWAEAPSVLRAIGATADQHAVGVDQYGVPMLVQPVITYNSDAGGIVKLDASGVATAYAAGSANLTAASVGLVTITRAVSVLLAPTFTSITPNSVTQGDSADSLTVAGTGITSDTTLEFSDPKITLVDVTPNANTTALTAHINVASDATVGAGTVKLHSTSAGDSGTLPFTVTAAPTGTPLGELTPASTGSGIVSGTPTVSGNQLTFPSSAFGEYRLGGVAGSSNGVDLRNGTITAQVSAAGTGAFIELRDTAGNRIVRVRVTSTTIDYDSGGGTYVNLANATDPYVRLSVNADASSVTVAHSANDADWSSEITVPIASFHTAGSAIDDGSVSIESDGSSVVTVPAVLPRLPAVTGLVAVVNSDRTVTLTWVDAAGASSYTVQEDGADIGTVNQGIETFTTGVGGGAPSSSTPILPRVTPTASYPTVTGSTWTATDAASLQSALNSAQYGDEVVLTNGNTFAGNFILPAKSGWTPGAWIVVRSSDLSSLTPGIRVQPADAAHMPTLSGTDATNPTLYTPSFTDCVASNGWYLAGLEVTMDPSLTTYGAIVGLGDGSQYQNSPSLVSTYFVVDRCYIHGNATVDFKRGLAPNCGWLYVHECYIADCHSNNNDSQAIGCWHANGPHNVDNNYLEGSGENVLYGGSDPGYLGQIPEDITYTRNHIYKPPTWNRNLYGYVGDGAGGTGWEVKNSFELKCAKYVLVEGNVIENCWADSQNGWAVLLKTNNSDDPTYGAQNETAHVTFRKNLVKNVGAFCQVSGLPGGAGVNANHLVIANNLVYNNGTTPTPYGTGTYGEQQSNNVFWSGGVPYLTVEHNTCFGSAWNSLHIIADANGVLQADFVFKDNLCGYDGCPNQLDDGNGIGTGALDRQCGAGAWTFEGNVLVGASAGSYPTGNAYPATLASLNLNTDLSLPTGSSYKGTATDGTDPGADVATVLAATSGVVQAHG